jgi:hypothetical protein
VDKSWSTNGVVRARDRLLWNEGSPALAFAGCRETTRPQERADVFKRDAADQIFDKGTANDELTALSVTSLSSVSATTTPSKPNMGKVKSAKLKAQSEFDTDFSTLNFKL